MESTVFQKVFDAAEKKVKYCTSDFEIDKKLIGSNPKMPFIHIAREHGTHLSLFHAISTFPNKGKRVKYLFGFADRKKILESALETFLYYTENNPKYIQYFDGRALKRVSVEQAVVIFKKYHRGILACWEEEDCEMKLKAS